MARKTDLRWSDTEWAAIEQHAALAGTTPGRFVKAAVCRVLDQLAAVTSVPDSGGQKIGSAAPKERESGAGATPCGPAGADVLDGGPASSRSAEGPLDVSAAFTDVASKPLGAFGLPQREGERDLMGELKESLDRVPRTTGGGEAFLKDALAHDRDWPKGSVVTTRANKAAVEEAMRRDGLLPPVESAGSSVPVPPAGGAAPAHDPAGAAAGGTPLVDAVVAALRAQGVVNSVELVARKVIRSGQVVVDGEPCRDPDRLVDAAALGLS